MDKGHWPRCLLWHGWLPVRSGVNGASPWAAGASESAGHLVEVALGHSSPMVISEWSPLDGFDAVEAASRMPNAPNVWTDGNLVLDHVTGVSFSGAGFFFAHQSADGWRERRWGHVDHVRPDGEVQSSRRFRSVPGPLQTVQVAEMWGVILALQSADAVHLGVDNLGVVRHVGRLLDGRSSSTPLELVTDGDLLLLVERMPHLRGLDTVRNADEVMVLDGRVRELAGWVITLLMRLLTLDRGGLVMLSFVARRNLSGVCGRWYPVILDLHRFFIAISRAGVYHDGSDVGLLVPSPRGVGWFMRFVTGLCCLDHLLFGTLNGSLCLQPLSVLMFLLIGPMLLVFW